MGLIKGGRSKAALAAIWLASLLLVPLAARLLVGETRVVVLLSPNSPTELYATVAGTGLAVPTDKTDPSLRTKPLTIHPQAPDPPESSLYWQPGQDNLLSFLGKAGEAMQSLRPAAYWGSPSVASGPSAPSQIVSITLYGGRAPARLDLVPEQDGTSGYELVVQPERRNIAWWRLENGKAVEELASGIYRPRGSNSIRELALELLLIANAASAMAFLCWLGGSAYSKVRKRVPEASPWGRPKRVPPNWLRGQHVAPLAIFVTGTVLTAAACVFVLDAIPHVQDDVAYIFQGRIFALGRSWVPVPPGPQFFANGFIQMFDGRWFTKYPPGYSLLLVPAIWAGVPWLINPLSAGVALALIYATGRRMYGGQVALWAALLGLLSPWVVLMSGSFMSHPTTMMWTALFLYALVCMRDEGRPARIVWPLVGGFAMGMAFITREWTAIGIAAGAALWALGDISLKLNRTGLVKIARYAIMLVGFVPPLLFLLYENKQLTGDWFRLAQDLVGSYDRPGFGPGHGDAQGHTPALGVYNTLVYLRTFATVFDGWPAPLALAPIALGLVAWVGEKVRQKLAWDALNVLAALGLIGAYFAWWSSTTIFGPRYWYEALPFFLLLAARGLDLLGRLAASFQAGERASTLRWLVPGGLFALLSLYTLTQSIPFQAMGYKDYNGISAVPLRRAEGAGLKDALIFVQLDPTKPNRDYGKVFFANDPLLKSDRVYVRDLGPRKNSGLLSSFPGRSAYWLPLDGSPQPGVGP